MAAEIFNLLGKIGVDNGEANSKIDETVAKAKKGGDSIGGSFNQMSERSVSFARNAAAALGAVAIAVGSFSIKAAGDMQALNSQFSQSFAGLGDAPTEALDALSDKFNILPNRLKAPMSQINSFFKGSGVSAKDSLGMTTDAMNIAADSAAFYDTSIEDTSASLKGFLMGKLVAPYHREMDRITG